MAGGGGRGRGSSGSSSRARSDRDGTRCGARPSPLPTHPHPAPTPHAHQRTRPRTHATPRTLLHYPISDTVRVYLRFDGRPPPTESARARAAARTSASGTHFTRLFAPNTRVWIRSLNRNKHVDSVEPARAPPAARARPPGDAAAPHSPQSNPNPPSRLVPTSRFSRGSQTTVTFAEIPARGRATARGAPGHSRGATAVLGASERCRATSRNESSDSISKRNAPRRLLFRMELAFARQQAFFVGLEDMLEKLSKRTFGGGFGAQPPPSAAFPD